MTTRKVTAAEEKVLTLAVEWAEHIEAARMAKGQLQWYACANEALRAQGILSKAAARLLKQRRAKGA